MIGRVQAAASDTGASSRQGQDRITSEPPPVNQKRGRQRLSENVSRPRPGWPPGAAGE